MRTGRGTSASLRETHNWLVLAATEAEELDAVRAAEERLTVLAEMVERAKDSLPAQTRHTAPDWRMVERIWSVLIANQSERDDPETRLAVERLNALAGTRARVQMPLKPFTLSPSYSPGSPFQKICAAVFAELTGRDADTERALKEFIKRRKARPDSRSRKTSA
jgi:hypothetical protein